MLTVRRAKERGRTKLGWLDSHHTFSFADYLDKEYISFGPLRVINEDTISPGGGFGTHPHRDMEIITYVTEGQLEHRDSLGTGSRISPGEIQKMSAGSGILHSEFNASQEKPVHLLQIWIVPDKRDIQPRYEQESFQLQPGEIKLLGSPDGTGLVSIQQNVRLYALVSQPGSQTLFEPAPEADLWIQIVKGACEIDSTPLFAGDGAAVSQAEKVCIVAKQPVELLLFEIPAA